MNRKLKLSGLALALAFTATGAWAQANLGTLPDKVDVNDVQIKNISYIVFSSRDTIMINPQTGQQDTVTIDMGSKIYTPEEYQQKREAKKAAILELVEKEKARMRQNAPVVNADKDWTYEGIQERSSARLYSFTYPSVDADGNPVRLSALMGVPMTSVIEDIVDVLTPGFAPWGSIIGISGQCHPSNVVIGCHVTITSNWEAPTSYEHEFDSFGLENFQTDTGMMLFYTRYDVLRQPCCLVILPDYEGYGVTKDRPHPYLYQELTARQCVDATRYGLALYNSKVAAGDEESLEEDWKTICVGFSQGGSVSLATHKYIETNNLVDELRFAGSVCGDGPYSPVDHVIYYMKDNGDAYDGKNKTYHKPGRVSMPIVMPLILKGMIDCNPYMRQNNIRQYLTENFLNTGVIEFIEAKNKPEPRDQFSTDNVNDEFVKIKETGKYKGIEIAQKDSLFPFFDGKNMHGDLKYMFTEECYNDLKRLADDKGDVQNGFMKDLMKALESNNLTVGWTPQKRIGFYHTTYDTVVPYVNLLTFMKKQDGLTYYFADQDNKPSETAGVYPTHVTTDETKADVMIIDTNCKKDHVPAGREFFLFGSVTSPDYQLMKWVLEGKQ